MASKPDGFVDLTKWVPRDGEVARSAQVIHLVVRGDLVLSQDYETLCGGNTGSWMFVHANLVASDIAKIRNLCSKCKDDPYLGMLMLSNLDRED